MIAHLIPLWPAVIGLLRVRRQPRSAGPVPELAAGEGRDGPVRVPLHAPNRCERTRFGAGIIPGGLGTRRLRRTLLPSGARSAGARCRGQCLTRRDSSVDCRICALFRTARAIRLVAIRHERDAQDRQRGPRGADGNAESPFRHHRCCDLRRSRPQISNLGTQPLSRGARGGHREGPHVQAGAGDPDGGGKAARSTGMTAGSGSDAVAGGPARHIPVLARLAIDWLAVKPGGLYVDATFGGGGYARAIMQTVGARVIGIDRDHTAVAQGAPLVEQAQGQLQLVEDRFSNLDAILESIPSGANRADGIVFDLGVSSMQLDEAMRGFSFRLDGPLDMRMGSRGPSAADVVARAEERELAAIIARLGEEKHARAVARAIVRARPKQNIDSTRALAEIVAAAVPGRHAAIHPATRTFQALRIFVNDELSELALGLAAAERALKPLGRLVVVAFHSLEDRIVKTFLAERSRGPAGSRHRPEIAAPRP